MHDSDKMYTFAGIGSVIGSAIGTIREDDIKPQL